LFKPKKGDFCEKQYTAESAESESESQSETAETNESAEVVTLGAEVVTLGAAFVMTRQKLISKDFEKEARERLQTSPLRTEQQQFRELYNKFLVRNSSDVTFKSKPNLPSD
jgi:hypothetical protein